MSEMHHEAHERRILGTELLWAFGVGILIAATLSMIVFTALTRDINPPSNVERLDPKTLHLSGEFAEQNLGTSVGADGSVTTRVVAILRAENASRAAAVVDVLLENGIRSVELTLTTKGALEVVERQVEAARGPRAHPDAVRERPRALGNDVAAAPRTTRGVDDVSAMVIFPLGQVAVTARSMDKPATA